ncbi:Furin-like protease 2,Proprotein convertase subtilisin/kexin type 6,Furin,Endoprotease bli-4,Proprotein convertase subtilisin/kexin type 5 [Mytilus coruscus]|uniref:Furin-like protease 2,Proprotein convertase subtilisin/kexin type 6,Furin,Endoprotease bli-4,Proprotein convertase subtilisin/kexin type 5 n=1 Tax=Mytilus coruscus TaxID=42192 RepID=A0A6J8AAJ1_MYTCO|nr:Furin-like protease 2,Proprotein convertase subtilisin/kexin type 6,Furin,Endoprotease bli-4,Proprotein convertase subtilisin/kexin type 5 [Mytilus coruscus]
MKSYFVIILLHGISIVSCFDRFLNEEERKVPNRIKRLNVKNGEFTNRIVFTTTREDDPSIWFNEKYPQYEYIGQFWIGNTKYITAQIRQKKTKEALSTLREDSNVKALRQSPEISWVEQEKAYVRKARTVDTEWPNLWYLNGDISPTMKVDKAWAAGYSGKGITIAVLDDGLQTDHPDLAVNIDTANNRDIYDNDYDPNPTNGSSHGTEVSGLIGAVKDNSICVVGVAFKSTLIGIRILGALGISDSDEAQALTHYISKVDIYSNSWGPDDGIGFNGPKSITKAALQNGVTYTTTTTPSGCKNKGVEGTSYAAPIASGIVALTLEANPNLTWRDIQHLIVLTSNRNGFNDTYDNWSINGAKKEFNQVLGFGLMDAEGMISYGKNWVPVPIQQTCTLSKRSPSLNTTTAVYDSITVTSRDCSSINYLEHVVVDITFSYSSLRGSTQLYLISPSGTISHLLHYRYQDEEDTSAAGNQTWAFMSVHFWKENPTGTWYLEIHSYLNTVTVTLNSWSLKFYGTSTDPWPSVGQTSSASAKITTEPKTQSTTVGKTTKPTPKSTTLVLTTKDATGSIAYTYNTNVPMIAGIVGAFIAIIALVGAVFATYALIKNIKKLDTKKQRKYKIPNVYNRKEIQAVTQLYGFSH